MSVKVLLELSGLQENVKSKLSELTIMLSPSEQTYNNAVKLFEILMDPTSACLALIMFLFSSCLLWRVGRPDEISLYESTMLKCNVLSYLMASIVFAKTICNYVGIPYFTCVPCIFGLYQWGQGFLPMFEEKSKIRFREVSQTDELRYMSVLAAISSNKAYGDEPFLLDGRPYDKNDKDVRVIEKCGVKVICDGTKPGWIIVTFRGTNNTVNWLNNFRMGQTVEHPRSYCDDPTSKIIPEPVGVHSGFWTSYSAVREDLTNKLPAMIRDMKKDMIGDDKNVRLVACGHSLGGALAELSTLDYNYLYVITFNSPACGDKAFGSYFRKEKCTSLRFANEASNTWDYVNRGMDILYGLGIGSTWYQHPCRTLPIETGHSWWQIQSIHNISEKRVYNEVFKKIKKEPSEKELSEEDIFKIVRDHFGKAKSH
eukprot:TRINITY_DN11898_c0_g1_i1.p1 TRINITY_DN11898_c0_g1~~TRINITY_DN11898_c0_g1_i1.p1  ORF type:complete len:427 (+),score=34.78 TRINITY_DN11898_c0_g1_i1:158-1438(+)